jgi:hypothetical protein
VTRCTALLPFPSSPALCTEIQVTIFTPQNSASQKNVHYALARLANTTKSLSVSLEVVFKASVLQDAMTAGIVNSPKYHVELVRGRRGIVPSMVFTDMGNGEFKRHVEGIWGVREVRERDA